MTRRSWLTLGAIAIVVVGLAIVRERGRTSTEPAPEQQVSTEIPAILDFGRGECVACRKMMPILNELRAAYRGVVAVRYFDLAQEAAKARAAALEVRLIPTQIFVTADGREVYRHEGFLPREDIDRKLEELGWIPHR